MLDLRQEHGTGTSGSRPGPQPVVIVVDDEPWILSAIRRVLRREPYEVRTTERPEEALEWIRRGNVSVLVTDQRMPSMSGTELLHQVRKCSPSTGCVILTGHPGGTIIIKGFTVGVDRMIYKPWDDEALRATVRQLVLEWELGPLGDRLEDN